MCAHNTCAIPVRGDGHCLLYAVAVGLPLAGVQCLLQEVSDQVEFYSSSAVDVISETTRYIEQKAYDSDVADMLLNALCNALRVDAVVIQWSTPFA